MKNKFLFGLGALSLFAALNLTPLVANAEANKKKLYGNAAGTEFCCKDTSTTDCSAADCSGGNQQ